MTIQRLFANIQRFIKQLIHFEQPEAILYQT